MGKYTIGQDIDELPIEEQLEFLTKKIKEVRKKSSLITKIKSSKTIKCCGKEGQRGCGKRSLISSLELIQTHWYEEPWGCIHRESNFICPKCGARNRPVWNPDFKRAGLDFRDVSFSFKGITNEHKD